MSAITVDVSDFVVVQVNISPLAIPFQNFGLPLVLGDSSVIDTNQRFRTYQTLTQIAADYGTTAPEYLAAVPFFSQTPQPNLIMMGQWARVATSGLLHGAQLTPSQQLIANFNAVTNGSFQISIDGVPHSVSSLNFSAALNLPGIAAIIQTALRAVFTGNVTCVWGSNFGRFDIVSSTTGTSSSVSFGGTISPLGGTTDVSTLLGLTAASGASPIVIGIAAETALAAVQALAGASSQWYSATFASSVMPSDSDFENVAAYILGSTRSRLLGLTIQNTACLDPTNTNDLASVLQSFNNKRVCWVYSSFNAYAIMSVLGRAFTVNFNGNNTTITLAYKQMPGIPGENLNETQFATVQAKGGNVNIIVDNGAVMIWPGQMTNGFFFDEVHGVDWLQNRIQTDVFNLFYQSTTKIPQTDAGNQQVCNTIEGSCVAAVNNGLSAPGQWNAGGFGSLNQGDTLTKGFYVYAPLIATQSQSDREARKSVPIQTAVKLAGAIHTADIILNINR